MKILKLVLLTAAAMMSLNACMTETDKIIFAEVFENDKSDKAANVASDKKIEQKTEKTLDDKEKDVTPTPTH